MSRGAVESQVLSEAEQELGLHLGVAGVEVAPQGGWRGVGCWTEGAALGVDYPVDGKRPG